jgi:hypothetical protein
VSETSDGEVGEFWLEEALGELMGKPENEKVPPDDEIVDLPAEIGEMSLAPDGELLDDREDSGSGSDSDRSVASERAPAPPVPIALNPLIDLAIRPDVVAGRTVLQEALHRQATSPTCVLKAGMISLILHDGDVMFVQWTAPDLMGARQVSIDEHGRVKTIVACVIPVCYYKAATILIRDTGAVMVRARAASRPPMAPWCLVVQRHRRMSDIGGPLLDDPTGLGCVVCRHGHSASPADVSKAHLFMCSCCLVAYHDVCALRLHPYGLTTHRQDTLCRTTCPICVSLNA